MADNQDGRSFLAIGPTGRNEQLDDIAVGAEPFVGFKRQAESFCRLLAADCRTNQNAQVLRRVLLQPFSHLRCLIFAACGEFAFEVGEAVFGFGVAPE